MPTASRPTRLLTLLRWPVSLLLVSWRYLWQVTPLHRSEDEGGDADLPEDWATQSDGLQGFGSGVGPLLHRHFTVRIVHSSMNAPTLLDRVVANLNQASPEMTIFRKTRGEHDRLSCGDEFVVRMPGPWDGPVRVIRRSSTSFRLATLPGHLEAGQVEFRVSGEDAVLRFEIEVWARAGDRLAHLLYNRLRLAKEVQLNMWSHVCVHAAALAGGKLDNGISIRTRWVDWPLTANQGEMSQDPAVPPTRADERPSP